VCLTGVIYFCLHETDKLAVKETFIKTAEEGTSFSSKA
jgi:hypothetical protein